jgi:GNAT superfamily N-acetyltransferase
MVGSNRFCHFGGWSDRGQVSGAGSRGTGGRPSGGTGGRPSGASTGEETGGWSVRSAGPEDREAWADLFVSYCDFYERPSTAAQRERVWGWIEAGTICCLLAIPAGSTREPAVGLAHVRPTPSPLRATFTGYLDDLFVAPAARGTGAFDALVGGIRALAGERGWETVRWITAADNARAQAAYERVATRTEWVTYQLDI